MWKSLTDFTSSSVIGAANKGQGSKVVGLLGLLGLVGGFLVGGVTVAFISAAVFSVLGLIGVSRARAKQASPPEPASQVQREQAVGELSPERGRGHSFADAELQRREQADLSSEQSR